MIEVIIDSIRASLTSQGRVIMLRDVNSDRQLVIWIGICESDSIAIELQDNESARPLTHDLLKNVIEQMGGVISHIEINDLRDQTYYALLYYKVGKQMNSIDCRPSDAIAVAVRAKVPIYVAEEIMDDGGITPEPDISISASDEEDDADTTAADPKLDAELDAFRSFLDDLSED